MLIINKQLESLRDTNFQECAILLINKPLRMTSFDVVGKVRAKVARKLGIKAKSLKVGHGGTLDPLATGLMIIGIGKATKQMQQFQDEPKQYVAEIKFGATTPSFDRETEENQTFSLEGISAESISKILQERFTGEIEQRPPLFSAKRIDGVRAYLHAREGNSEMMLAKNKITIYSTELLSYNEPIASVSIHCSKGTYIRSFADDLGREMNSGAYLTGLLRQKSGGFDLNDALSIEDFEKLLTDF